MTILTPKGYSSARRASSEKPEAPEQPAPASTPPPPPQPKPEQPSKAAQGQQQVKLHFPPQVIGVNCPNCGTPYPTQVFSIVDVGQDAILKSLILSGQLNMAVCPRCGAGGSIASPLLYHDPEHSFLGVHVPEQVGDQQKIIGDLSRRHMNGLPQEARRGYMLTPKQFFTYQSLLEAILENEGVTREMMDAQRKRLQLLEQAISALQDEQGLKQLAHDHDQEMDDEFFGLLQTVANSATSQGDEQSARGLLALRERLIELTTWGKGVQKQREAVARIKPETTPTELLDMVVAADDDRVVDALITVGQPLVNYGFYQELAGRIEAANQRRDTEESQRLSGLRQHILGFSDRLQQLQRASVEQASQILNEILGADDIRQAVEEFAPYVDQTLLSVLAANLQRAEEMGATAAVKRLQEAWDAVLEIVQADAPPILRLINDLVSAEYPGETRKLLGENRDQINTEFIEALNGLAQEMAEEGDAELAAKIRQVRSQAQLML